MTEITKSQLEAVRSLAEHVRERMFPYLSSAPNMLPRQYAAAALARCNRLLLSMFEMREIGYSDLIGIAARSYLECWWIGVYLAMAPDEALLRLNASHVNQVSRMDSSWGDMSYLIENLPHSGNAKAINMKELADRVDKLYSASSPETVNVAKRLYEVLYRGESMMSVHGGLGTISGHMRGAPPGALTVSEIGLEPDDGESRILLVGGLHDTLARTLAGLFHLSTSEIDRLGRLLDSPESEVGD